MVNATYILFGTASRIGLILLNKGGNDDAIVSDPRWDVKILVSSKTLPDMYQELDICTVYASLRRGLLSIMQTHLEFDETNFIYDGVGVMVTVYVVRARASGIGDLIEDDLQQFMKQITLIGE